MIWRSESERHYDCSKPDLSAFIAFNGVFALTWTKRYAKLTDRFLFLSRDAKFSLLYKELLGAVKTSKMVKVFLYRSLYRSWINIYMSAVTEVIRLG